MVGLLNGLLPCGFVYIALAGASSAPGVGGAMLYMALFGLGTFPLMFLVSLSGKLISLKMRSLFNRAMPYIGVALAVLFIVRGLSLGILYLSPEDDVHGSAHHRDYLLHKASIEKRYI